MNAIKIFNEWHSANTSKKLRAVHASGAKAGKYYATYCAFGYLKGDDGKRTPVIDPDAAPIVRRIFEMRASGYGMKKIADVLNAEHIPTPMDYQYKRIGKIDPHDYTHIWASSNVKLILNNPIYIGTLAQHRSTSVSYKNHKRVFYDPSEWIVIENNHLIGSTTTSKGLKVKCVLDENEYKTGIKVSEYDYDRIDIERIEPLSDWNYIIRGFIPQ